MLACSPGPKIREHLYVGSQSRCTIQVLSWIAYITRNEITRAVCIVVWLIRRVPR